MMRKEILHVPIDWVSEEGLEQKLHEFIRNHKPHQITTVNPEFIVLSHSDSEFKHALQESDLSLADGTGIVLAQTFIDSQPRKNKLLSLIIYLGIGFRILLTPHSSKYHRITGVELSERLMSLASQHEWKVYLLGAAPGIAHKAAKLWQEAYSGLNVVGTSSANPQDRHVVQDIIQKKPDILLVAYGAPKQDLFIFHHKEILDVPIMVGVGGTFDYITGTMKRPPIFVRTLGLEWVFRLAQQPKRIKRIWRSTIIFSWRIITSS